MATDRKTERNLRHEQAAETREKLLAAAKNLFARNGYHGTPVRAINRELGMADGILYHYFPGGKREMLNVLLKESFLDRAVLLDETNQLMEELPLAEALSLLSTRLHRHFLNDIDMMRILLREHEALDSEGTDMLSKLILERQRWFAGFLERRHAKGEIRQMDFAFAAKQFMSMNMLQVISKILDVDLTGAEDADRYREWVIRHTMDLWQNP